MSFPGKYETRLEIKKEGERGRVRLKDVYGWRHIGVARLETDRFSGFSSHPNLKPPFHPGQCHVRLEIRSRFSPHLNIFSKYYYRRHNYLPSYIFLSTKQMNNYSLKFYSYNYNLNESEFDNNLTIG